MTLTAAVNMNMNNAAGMKTSYIGPSVAVNKMFLDKTLRTGVNMAYNQSRVEGKNDAPVVSAGIHAFWNPKPADKEKRDRHTVNANLGWIQRFESDLKEAQKELTATLTYGYKF